jgi:hypothetical protein
VLEQKALTPFLFAARPFGKKKMNQKQFTTGQPNFIEDLCEGSQLMTEGIMKQKALIYSEPVEAPGNFETVEETGLTGQVSEEKVMFELELETLVDVEFTDCTFTTEEELVKFLKTLTETQLRDTEVLEDDDTFVVFYPLLPVKVATSRKTPRSGYHFDTDAPRPTVHSDEAPELVGILAEQFCLPAERAQGQAMREMLASISI